MSFYKRECGGPVLLCFALLLAVPLPGAAQQQPPAEQTREIGGKTLIQRGAQWYVEHQGRLYEVDDRVITIRFRSDVEPQALDSFLVREGLEVIRSNRLGFIDVRIPLGADPVEYVERLREQDIVESVDINTRGQYFSIMSPTDPLFASQWHLPRINVASDGWQVTTGSKDVVVAVLDSGTDVGHEDLSKNVWINPAEDTNGDQTVAPSNPDHLDNADKNGVDDDSNGFVDDLVGWDFFNNNNNVRGPFFHGTHVAGIVAASTDNATGVAGVAGGAGPTPGTLVMAVGVGDSSPDGSVLDDAIIYAADNGARIITMSLSVAPSAAIDAAIDYAFVRKGVFLDNAAGNGGGAVSYPATLPLVVAVGSVDQTDTVSSFSNRGPELELAAPGEEIWSTQLNNNYNQGDGTSYASPQVAGVAALLLACKPTLTNKELRNILQTTAVDLGAPGRDNLYGFGRIDAAAALKAAGCAAEPPEKPVVFKYAAKVVCGVQEGPDDMRLAQGFYATTINIQNPNVEQVTFTKKLALSFPPAAQRPGRTLTISEDVLGEDEALKVDCPDLQRRLFPGGFPTPYIEGFVVIKSRQSLNVTAVYTTRSLERETCCKTKHGKCCPDIKAECCPNGRGSDCCSGGGCCRTIPGAHSSIDVEQIVERQIEEMPDDERPRRPDLVPLPGRDPDSRLQPFCVIRDGMLAVRVRNQGEGPAGASVTEVDYFNVGQAFQAGTSQLGPNEEVELLFEKPDNCGGETCQFRIAADRAGQVEETNEANNVAEGFCFTPL
jgi:subtilisin family serine protease